MEIGYCSKCNVPLRGEHCDVCNSKSVQLKFHNMGDIRPASSFEIGVLMQLIPYREVKNYFRTHLILLSKQPGLDYRKDVFLDGYKIGTMEFIYDLRWRWKFTPTGKGAALFHALSNGAAFKLQSSGHLKGKRIAHEIQGDWEIFTAGSCVGVAVHTEKGTKVKDIFCHPVKTKRKNSIGDAVSANRVFLEKIEQEAVKKIKRAKANYVAFSGGKDSEVALYLASKAGVKKAIYANTGLEFPESVRFAYQFAEYLNIELIEVRPRYDFWKAVKENGIPTKDSRWCTKFLKLEQLKKFNGIMVDGTRRYESFGRMTKGSKGTLGNLQIIYPIIDWLALDIWLYINWKNLPHNLLYDIGYERIGCYLCPSMLTAEFHNMRRTHPELFKTWYTYLRKQGYSNDEIMNGVWRWHKMPAKLMEIHKS